MIKKQQIVQNVSFNLKKTSFWKLAELANLSSTSLAIQGKACKGSIKRQRQFPVVADKDLSALNEKRVHGVVNESKRVVFALGQYCLSTIERETQIERRGRYFATNLSFFTPR